MKQKLTLISTLVLSALLIFCGSVSGEALGSLGIVPEDSFIVKLGTFLFITTVLVFLLIWRRKKQK